MGGAERIFWFWSAFGLDKPDFKDPGRLLAGVGGVVIGWVGEEDVGVIIQAT